LKNIDWNVLEHFSPLDINPPIVSSGISSGITIQWNFINFSAIIFIDEDESKDTTYSILTNDCNNGST
jgi:hypothetical protein